MAQISKKYLDQETGDRMFQTFSHFFHYALTRNNAKVVLSEFFTPTEKVYLAKRLMIAYFLIKEVDWVTIKDVLKVSLTTIWSVSNRLDTDDAYLRGKLSKFFRTQPEGKKATSFLEQLLDSIEEDIRYGFGASGKKQHRLEHEGKRQ